MIVTAAHSKTRILILYGRQPKAREHALQSWHVARRARVAGRGASLLRPGAGRLPGAPSALGRHLAHDASKGRDALCPVGGGADN